MANFISLDIELSSIRSFLKTVLDAADMEYARIKEKSEAGKYKHYEDEGNALSEPIMWEEIAFRATLGELNALVEWELRNLANKAFFENIKSSDSRKVKTVFELNVNEVIKLIEKYYKIKVNETASYLAVVGIREKVNSFKHRKGFKNPWKNKNTVILEKFRVDRKEAFKSMDCVKSFIKDLWSSVKDNKKV